MPTFPPRYRRAARPKKDLRYWRNPNQIFHIKKVDEQTHSRLDGSSEWRIEQRRLNPKTTGALGLKVKAERESKEISGTASQLFDPEKGIDNRGLGAKRHATNVRYKKQKRARNSGNAPQRQKNVSLDKRYRVFE